MANPILCATMRPNPVLCATSGAARIHLVVPSHGLLISSYLISSHLVGAIKFHSSTSPALVFGVGGWVLENLKLLLLPLLLLLSTMAAADAWRPAASNLCRSTKGRDARLRDGVTLGPIRCHA